mgnify:CR=1 FL=1
MTAKVIGFPAIRFTPADMALWEEIAADYIGRGIWDRADRESNQHGDMLLIWHPNRATPMFVFTRTPRGYSLMFATGKGWEPVWQGKTAHDVLKVWLERVRMPQPGQRSAANA